MNEKVKIVIYNTLRDNGFSQDYIKYSSYKYEWFEGRMIESYYNAICDDMDLHFDERERKVLFEIIEKLGYKIKHFNDYSFFLK